MSENCSLRRHYLSSLSLLFRRISPNSRWIPDVLPALLLAFDAVFFESVHSEHCLYCLFPAIHFLLSLKIYEGFIIFVIFARLSEFMAPRIFALESESIAPRIFATRSKLSVMLSNIVWASLGFIDAYVFA